MKAGAHMFLSSALILSLVSVTPLAALPLQDQEGEQEEPKTYSDVITDDTETDEGVFTVHRLDQKVFYEIPVSELGREFLWVSQIARTTEGVGYGGQALGNRVVSWNRRGDQVLLKSVSYAIVADDDQPISQAVRAAKGALVKVLVSLAGEQVDGISVVFDAVRDGRRVSRFDHDPQTQPQGQDETAQQTPPAGPPGGPGGGPPGPLPPARDGGGGGRPVSHGR